MSSVPRTSTRSSFPHSSPSQRFSHRKGLAIPEWFAVVGGLTVAILFGAGFVGELAQGSLTSQVNGPSGVLGRQVAVASIAGGGGGGGGAAAQAPQEEGTSTETQSNSGGGDFKFSLYNWNVAVGQTLDLSAVVSSGSVSDVRLSGNSNFAEPFMAGQTVGVTAEMLLGGDHGAGNYRIFAINGAGETVDHITIRVR